MGRKPVSPKLRRVRLDTTIDPELARWLERRLAKEKGFRNLAHLLDSILKDAYEAHEGHALPEPGVKTADAIQPDR